MRPNDTHGVNAGRTETFATPSGFRCADPGDRGQLVLGTVRGVKRLTIVAALTLLVVTGCAKAHRVDPLTTSTRAPVDNAFLTKADAACLAQLKVISQRKFPYADFNPNDPVVSELPGVGEFYDSSSFSHNELSFVQGLGEPPTGRGTWNAFVSLVGQEQAATATQISAAKASNKNAFVSSVNQLATIESNVDSITAAAGFSTDSDCVTLFG
jgi:hypothetical protein